VISPKTISDFTIALSQGLNLCCLLVIFCQKKFIDPNPKLKPHEKTFFKIIEIGSLSKQINVF
jgi:hypothetical protein